MSTLSQADTFAIANGANLSNAVSLRDARSGCISLPAALTATSAKFRLSADGSTYVYAKDTAGTDLSITVGTSRIVQLPAALFAGAPWLKIEMQSNEGADRSIPVMLKD